MSPTLAASPLRCPLRARNSHLGAALRCEMSPTLAASPLRCPLRGRNSHLGAALRCECACAGAVPARRALPVIARHDGEVSGPRPSAAARRLGALRRTDARRDAVRVARRRRGVLENAPAADATAALDSPAGGHDLFLRRLAVSAAR